jgi:hypothetical protein
MFRPVQGHRQGYSKFSRRCACVQYYQLKVLKCLKYKLVTKVSHFLTIFYISVPIKIYKKLVIFI